MSSSSRRHGTKLGTKNPHLLFYAIMPGAERAASVDGIGDTIWYEYGLSGSRRPRHILHGTVYPVARFDEMPPEIVIDYARQVGDEVAKKAFDVELDYVASFGGRGNSRPVALSSSKPVPAFVILSKALRQRFSEIDFAFPRFSPGKAPHVTLGYDRMVLPRTILAEPMRWQADRLALIDSHQGQTHYTCLEEWALPH